MLNVCPRRMADCETADRRRFLLEVGSLSGLGLALPELLRGRSVCAADAPAHKGTNCILVWTRGGTSHHDTLDPKPDARAEVRGEFKPIATRTPGLQLGEVLPMLAQQSQHYTVVRSIGVDPKGLRNHGAAIYMLMTGHDPTNFSPTGLAGS